MSVCSTNDLQDKAAKYDAILKCDYSDSELRSKAAKGSFATFTGQSATLVLQIGSSVIMARLLNPSDYGLIAMITAITGFISLFRDLGLSMATVQQKDVSHKQVSTLFWITVALSVVFTLFTMALAPVIAWFYGEPRLTMLTIVMASGFLISGLAAQHGAIIRRQMRFQILAALSPIGMILSTGVGTVSALFGAGAWSLVFMQLSSNLFNVAMLWLVSPWRPGRPARGIGIRKMVAFGGYFTGFNILNYFARNLDNVLIGKFCGSQQLGTYNKAYEMLLMPINQINGPISSVAIPVLSRVQDDPERYQKYYKSAVSLIAYLAIPIALGMGALSKEIVQIAFGSKWTEVSTVFGILAFAAAVGPIASTAGWIYTSLGQTARMFKWSVIAVPVIVLSFIVGVHWGIIGVAFAYAVVYTFLIFIPCLWYAYKYSPIRLWKIVIVVIRPLIIGLTMWCAMQIARHYLGSFGQVARLVLLTTIGSLTFIIGCLVWGGARRDVIDTLKCWQYLREKP